MLYQQVIQTTGKILNSRLHLELKTQWKPGFTTANFRKKSYSCRLQLQLWTYWINICAFDSSHNKMSENPNNHMSFSLFQPGSPLNQLLKSGLLQQPNSDSGDLPSDPLQRLAVLLASQQQQNQDSAKMKVPPITLPGNVSIIAS